MALRILVLRGGPGGDHEFSMRSGKFVMDSLDKERYTPMDVVVNHEGTWYHAGKVISPDQAFAHADTVFNTIHGTYGEDGALSQIFQTFNMPHTSTTPLGASLAYKKIAAKRKAEELGIPVPKHAEIIGNDISNYADIETCATEIIQKFHLPVIIKPSHGGTSVGVTLANSFHDIVDGIKEGLLYAPSVLVEEYIQGKEASVSVFENMRDEDLYTPPPVEILFEKPITFFNRDLKHIGNYETSAPGSFSDEEKLQLQEAAKAMHEGLGLSHISQSDFIIHPKRGLFYLETNSIPLFEAHTPVVKSAESVGISSKELIEHLIKSSLRNTHHLV